MKQIEREKILEDITKKETRDNKVNYTVTTRLDYIRAKLSESDYEVYFETPLSVTYKKKNVILPERLVLLSTHIDCEKDIKKLDFKITKKGNYKGTFDNAVTNAVSVISMLEDTLNDNVIISFTGDEEEDSNGAIQVIEYLKELKKEVIAITLDATLDLKSEKDNDITTYKYASYTIDNLCANTSELFAKELFEFANKMNTPYMVTRVDDDYGRDYFDHKDITDYYDIKLEVEEAALPDESIEYSRYDCCLCAFSLCIPTNTDDIDVMHSDKLLKIKKEAFYEYLDAVVGISNRMAQVSDMDKNVN